MKRFKFVIGESKKIEFFIRCFFIDVKAQFIEIGDNDIF